MTYIKSYKELIVWQKSIILVKLVFLITKRFPNSELYGLVSQTRRSAVSIPSNIAEGYGRKSKKEYIHFCSIAYSSALELETQLIIARELEFISDENFAQVCLLLEEILKMLYAITARLEKLNAVR